MVFDNDQRDYLDANYVRKDCCVKQMGDVDKREDELNVAIHVLSTKMSWLCGILGAIGVAVLGIAVKVLFGM